MRSELRPHQVEGLAMLRAALKAGKKRPVLQMPTGAGKTILAAAIVEGVRAKGNTVVFTVPAVELIDQTVAAFGAEGIEQIGVIQADHVLTDYRKPVQVASVQTLARREQLPYASIVVVDEAHQRFAIIEKWMQERPDLIFIGLTATPWARGMAKTWDALITPVRMQALIDAGYLAPYRVFAPAEPDLSKVSIRAGDYAEDELSDVMSQPELVADVVATWLKLGENRPTLCFGVDRAHARKLQGEFEAAGIPSAYMDAYTERHDRDAIRRAFHDGGIKVVCNVGVLTTGVDWDVRCLILARPTRSEMLFVQIVGRALRTAAGKTDALILDHSSTTQNLGFPSDIHADQLDDGSPRRGAGQRVEKPTPLPKKCTACTYLKPAGVHVCPSCGFTPERQSKIESKAGELVQLRGKAKLATRPDKQKFWSGLLWYCEDRGYRQGWASNLYREKFGVWPRDLHDISAPPDATCRGHVTAHLIAYRKMKGKRYAA
ncbi:MAG: DEAD/DEAH box helicase [Devosia sp.]